MKNNLSSPTNRQAKIKALLKRKLLPSALYQNEMTTHRLRGDVETSEDCWERAGKRFREIDPEKIHARRILRDLVHGP